MIARLPCFGLVVSVPARKVIYAADWLPLGELIWRNIFDSYIDEWLYWRNGWQ